MKPPMKIVYLSIESSNIISMRESCEKIQKKTGICIEYSGFEYALLENDALLYRNLVEATKVADFIYIRAMSDFNRFSRFKKYRKILETVSAEVMAVSGNIDLSIPQRELFKGDDASYKRLWEYGFYRGQENDTNLIWYAAKHLGFSEMDPPEPIPPRRNGIYHKKFPADIPTPDYLDTLSDDKITVGFVFGGALCKYGNLAHVDLITETIERMGMQAIPIFVNELNEGTSDGPDDIFNPYFRRNGKTIIDVLITLTSFSHLPRTNGKNESIEYAYFKKVLNVPILFAMTVTGDYHDFEEDMIGLGSGDMKTNVIYPELEGCVITVPIGYKPKNNVDKRTIPIPDRIDHLCELAGNWGRLNRKPNSEKKIVLMLWQSESNSGDIGSAMGLDTIQSTIHILERLKSEGYLVNLIPNSSEELVDLLQSSVTNDIENYSGTFIQNRSIHLVEPGEYEKQFIRIPQWDQVKTIEDWGKPPGDIMTQNGKLIIPGIVNGNVLITYQPVRGRADKLAEDLHDPLLFAQHQYLGFYRWIQESFKADAVLNIGTHGSMEWLPGKNVGLSSKCEPSIINGTVPNLYVYIIDDPGEGVQCKRRMESVMVGHMTPSMGRAGTYDTLEETEAPLQEYLKYRHTVSESKRTEMVRQTYHAAKKNNLLKDLGFEDNNDENSWKSFEDYIIPLHEYLSELKNALIRTNLHILGKVPYGKHLDEMVYSLTTHSYNNIPPLKKAFFTNAGVNLDMLLDYPSETNPEGLTNSQIHDSLTDTLMGFISDWRVMDYSMDYAISRITEEYGRTSEDLVVALRNIAENIIPRLRKTGDELDSIIDGLNGGYIVPGPAGAPTRGNTDVIPTGRNFYSIDPFSIPNKTAWSVGQKMADKMIDRFTQEKGEFPREVGFILWATDTVKTGGEDVAYILWLLGVRPRWAANGKIEDLEVIPLSELKRPRVDVSVNITALFRDTFPNLIELLDDAVGAVIDLDESDEDNCLAANFRKDMLEDISQGIPEDKARRANMTRLFGAPLGAYGTGVNSAVSSSQWETVADLADIYMRWCSNGYGRDCFGMKMKNNFIRRFSKVSATIKNMPDRELDILDTDDVYGYIGGMNSFVRTYGKKDAVSYIGDSSDPERLKLRSTQEELRFVLRSKALNPKFIEGAMEHGYRGAAELSDIVEFTMAWGATSNIAEDWMFEELMDTYVRDDRVKEWLEDVNPFALHNILNRLDEAMERGLWNVDEEHRKALEEAYLKSEEKIEELTDR